MSNVPVYIPPEDYPTYSYYDNNKGVAVLPRLPVEPYMSVQGSYYGGTYTSIRSNAPSNSYSEYVSIEGVQQPNQQARSSRIVIAIVAVLVLVLIAAVAATLRVTVFNGENSTAGAQEGKPPVDGIWNDWQAWSDCSASCDNGTMTRNRTCDNPPPTIGGKECIGSETESLSCKLLDCPIDGNWSEWQAWSDCSVTCGGGVMARNRTCDNPPPEHNGQDCDGLTSETSTCGEATCPPPGVWGIWGEWTDCSESCGAGVSIRTRICDDSAGGECVGANSETKVCQLLKCYDTWGDWSGCSFSCGSGMRTRNRTCDGKFTEQECGVQVPTFTDTKTCENAAPCENHFCASRNASCDYKHPNSCDFYITCDENKVMFEKTCNVLLRYKVRDNDACKGDCDWAANVPCS